MEPTKLRVLVMGAHCDDCEATTGGLAAKLIDQGHIVKYVSVTNGDAGHHTMQPEELAARRLRECLRVSELFGVAYEVMDNHDGRLEADVPTREAVMRVIRRFSPDIIITHRIQDYHPDHRRVGILVQDCSYLVRVPLICPDTPTPAKTPAILYMQDMFHRQAAFVPDVVVPVDAYIDTKVLMLHCHESQFYEWLPYMAGNLDDVPADDAGRIEFVRSWILGRHDRLAELLEDTPAGAAENWVEVYEVSEYGRPLTDIELQILTTP